ncbi:MAG: DegQ family serine endoprotease [Janthinobacterium lividum]
MSHFSLRRVLAIAAAACLPFMPMSAHAAPAAANLPDFTDLVDKVGPSVVNIRTTERQAAAQDALPPSMDDDDMAELFKRFFGIPLPRPGGPGGSNGSGGSGGSGSPHGRNAPPNDDSGPDQGPGGDIERSSGLGSGFILSSDGFVMTNAHVVDGADSIYVTLTDKREFKARLVGKDERTDVALLKIAATDLPAISIGDSNKVRVGEWVVAIGSPFGLDNTVTAGIVSAKGRNTGDYLPFIQTDVAVNPGNSGGPLLNMQGQVIGINNQIYSRTGGFMGISFSIPIDEAMRVVTQLKATGRVTRGKIGVAITEVSKDVADSLGLPSAEGAEVSSVEPGGPGDKAGLQIGDIITQFNGTAVSSATDLPRMVGDTKPGTRASIRIWRKREQKDLQVTIGELQGDQSSVKADTPAPVAPRGAPNQLGLSVADLSADQLKAMNLKFGVQVVAVDGPARAAGLRKGDVILRVADTDIVNAKTFDTVVRHLDPQRMAAVLVKRGDNSQFVPLRPRPLQK